MKKWIPFMLIAALLVSCVPAVPEAEATVTPTNTTATPTTATETSTPGGTIIACYTPSPEPGGAYYRFPAGFDAGGVINYRINEHMIQTPLSVQNNFSLLKEKIDAGLIKALYLRLRVRVGVVKNERTQQDDWQYAEFDTILADEAILKPWLEIISRAELTESEDDSEPWEWIEYLFEPSEVNTIMDRIYVAFRNDGRCRDSDGKHFRLAFASNEDRGQYAELQKQILERAAEKYRAAYESVRGKG